MTRIRQLLLILFLPLLALSVYEHWCTGNAGDKNWLLLAAEMWLNGKRLYVDIFEVDPPLIMWIFAIPAIVSRHVPGVSDIHALALFGFLVTGIVIAVSLLLIKRHPQFAQDKDRRRQFFLLLLFLFIFCTANNYFFDREFILLVLTFPYMLRFMPQLRHVAMPRLLRVTTGLLAAVGFCMKPHTMIVFAAIQLAYILRERSPAILRTAENGIIYAGGLTYLFCAWHFYPEYFTIVLPMALAAYGGYKNSGLVYLIIVFLIFGVSFADFRPGRRSPLKADIYYLLAVSAAYLIYALINNGWGYTYYPVTTMGLFVTAWVFWDHRDLLAKGEGGKSSLFGARACIINLLCNFAYAAVSLASFFSVPACDTNIECTKYRLLLGEMQERHAGSFGVMSEDFHKWAQVGRLYAWQTRFNNLWMLKSFAGHGPAFTGKNRWILDYLDGAFAADLDNNRPDVIFVETNIGVKLPDFFGRSEAFKEAWGRYRFLHTLDTCAHAAGGAVHFQDCRYDIYERSH